VPGSLSLPGPASFAFHRRHVGPHPSRPRTWPEGTADTQRRTPPRARRQDHRSPRHWNRPRPSPTQRQRRAVEDDRKFHPW